MNDAKAVFIYTTLSTSREAEALGEVLVRRRLAACVNIYPGIVSIYEWDGKLERDTETAMILKTVPDRAGELMAELARLHPYDEPAILQIPVTDGAQGYLDWLARQTSRR